MSSIDRKRKRDVVPSAHHADEAVQAPHKRARGAGRKIKRLDGERQKERPGLDLKKSSKTDGLPSPSKKHPAVVSELSDTAPIDSAADGSPQTTTTKVQKSKNGHDDQSSVALPHERRKKGRKAKHKSKKQQKEVQTKSEGQTRIHTTEISKKQNRPASVNAGWNVSQPLGGRLIDTDPIVTDDEKYLILAYPSTLNIYATKSSSLVRSLPVTNSYSKDTHITAYALSSTQPTNLYVATLKGILYQFDWAEGRKIGRWQLSTQVWSLAVATRNSSVGLEDVVYAREHSGDKWRISAHRLKSGSDASETESKTIYASSSPITQFKIIRDGKLIFATSGKRLIIGELKSDTPPSLKDMIYVWRELDTPDWISSIDVRESTEGSSALTTQRSHIKSRQSGVDDAVVDIVLGHAHGSINVYHDLINNLLRQERQIGRTNTQISPRSMHWHREDVLSVKWTPDGNYILSGGLETVLVLWQLDTDRPDFLPHLSAAINSIVISPSGTSYIIRLSDNSTMILSSSELKPKVYVGGIQAEALHCGVPLGSSNKKKVDAEYQDDPSNVQVPLVPATISGLNPSRLLLAVPTSAFSYSFEGAHNGCPYLQTIDLATAHHISRQALTRTNTTDVNIGPESNKLVEPTVTFIRTSHDGRWLATVDEWRPPRRDIERLIVDEDELKSELRQRTEIFLKFWSWNSVQKQWELVTRVDGPHSIADGQVGSGDVLDIQADPVSLGFSTIGEDGAIRLWKAKKRRRNKMVLYDENSQPLMEWSCHRVIRLGKVESPGQLDRVGHLRCRYSTTAARLAYSFDGSVLAASQSSSTLNANNTSGIVHFIDPDTGEIRRTQTGLYSGVLVSLGFVERYLVTIADNLMVWNTVQDCLCYGFSLHSDPSLSPKHKIALTHLAVDHSQGTFAISFPVVKSKKNRVLTRRMLKEGHSRIIIFDPKTPIPLYTTALPDLVTALVPLVDSTGYVVLDTSAQLRTIRNKSSLATFALDKDMSKGLSERVREGECGEAERTIMTGEVEEEEDVQEPPSNQIKDDDTLNDDDDDGPPVIRQEQLTEIFEVGPAYSLPPLHDLFGQVAELFSRKPLSREDKARP